MTGVQTCALPISVQSCVEDIVLPLSCCCLDGCHLSILLEIALCGEPKPLSSTMDGAGAGVCRPSNERLSLNVLGGFAEGLFRFRSRARLFFLFRASLESLPLFLQPRASLVCPSVLVFSLHARPGFELYCSLLLTRNPPSHNPHETMYSTLVSVALFAAAAFVGSANADLQIATPTEISQVRHSPLFFNSIDALLTTEYSARMFTSLGARALLLTT